MDFGPGAGRKFENRRSKKRCRLKANGDQCADHGRMVGWFWVEMHSTFALSRVLYDLRQLDISVCGTDMVLDHSNI